MKAFSKEGHWCGRVDKASVCAGQVDLFHAAVKAGWLADNVIDRIRFEALVAEGRGLHGMAFAGFIVSRIEKGNFGSLRFSSFREAIQLHRNDDPVRRSNRELLRLSRVNR